MVSPRDRTKMRRISIDLASGETSDRGTPLQRAQILALINTDRVAHGSQPLDDRAPEETLYDRARSLGMARVDR